MKTKPYHKVDLIDPMVRAEIIAQEQGHRNAEETDSQDPHMLRAGIRREIDWDILQALQEGRI